jgi:DNA polymerase-3 subunit delta'
LDRARAPARRLVLRPDAGRAMTDRMAKRKSAAPPPNVWSHAWPAPWDNPRLVGHDAAERHILHAVGSGRMPHAWLFCGPRGIGKSTLAHRFARFLLAGESAGGLFGEPSSLAVDIEHPAIRRMRAGGHADFRRIERSLDDRGRLRRDIVVDDVRDLGEFMHLTPAEGGWRIAVIDAADEMNRNAANALLKVLEEPPRRAALILVAHAPGRLLPTIRSRCRRLDLRPLGDPVVVDLLGDYLPSGDPVQRAALAEIAGGSIGQALTLAEAGSFALYSALIEVLASLPQLDIAAAHILGDRLARRGEESEGEWRALTFLVDWWLQRLLRGAAVGRSAPPLVPREQGLAERLLATASLDRWLEAWEKIRELFARADAINLDRKQVTLGALFTLQAAMAR